MQVAVQASPSTLVADGVSSTSVVAILTTCAGNPTGDEVVEFTASGSANTFSSMSGVTDGDGLLTTTLQSTKAEVKIVTATAGTSSCATDVTFVSGPPNASSSSIELSPTSATAGNSISISVVLEDAYGNPVGNQTLTLSASGTDNVFSSGGTLSGSTMTGETATSGIFTAQLSSCSAQTETIYVAVGAETQPLISVSVTFTP